MFITQLQGHRLVRMPHGGAQYNSTDLWLADFYILRWAIRKAKYIIQNMCNYYGQGAAVTYSQQITHHKNSTVHNFNAQCSKQCHQELKAFALPST